MNAVERLARELCRQYAKGMDESGDRTDIFNAWVPNAKDLLTELQAPQWALIEKWRRDADYLDEFADSENQIGAKCRRALAAELERMLEGEK